MKYQNAPVTPENDINNNSDPSPDRKHAWHQDMTRLEYLTIDQVAAMFQVTERTVQDWSRKGYLPVIRIAHTTRYKRSDVEQFVHEHFRLAGRSARGGAR